MFSAVLELTKYRLSISVLFSSIAGYLIAINTFSIETFMLLISGGFFLIGASNGFNQVMEKHTDALMDRTKNRPIPSGRIGAKSATFICLAMILIGIILLYLINLRTAFFGLISALIYLFLYTPLKSKTPLCVFFGAIPGAIPFMLGWVAATNKFGIEPLKSTINSFLKSVITKLTFSEFITIELSLTIPPTLIFLFSISTKLLISVGDKK